MWFSDPKNAKHFHFWATLFWLASLVPTIIWWKNSILWVGIMSCWANVAAHWASYQGASAEQAGACNLEADK